MGGMGLTGIILKAAIKLRSISTGWIKQKIIATKNLDETINLFETNESATYSVAWVDCFQKKENTLEDQFLQWRTCFIRGPEQK